MKKNSKRQNKSVVKSYLTKEIRVSSSITKLSKVVLILVFLILFSLGLVEVINRSFAEQKNNIINKSQLTQIGNAIGNYTIPSLARQEATPSALKTHSITGMAYSIRFDTAKYLNPDSEDETYLIEFRKQTPGLEYAISEEKFNKIYLLDKNYLVSIVVPKEGIPMDFDTMPKTTRIKTNNFGEVLKIKSERDLSENLGLGVKAQNLTHQYLYTAKIEPKCGFGNYCGLMELAFPSPLKRNGVSYVSLVCYALSELDSKNCDSILASMKISQIN